MPSRTRSRTVSRSRSRSPATRGSRSPSRTPPRRDSRSRSRSPARRDRSRSRSYVKRRRDSSRSPMSNRRRHVGDREEPDPSKCIGVFGLSLYTTERQLDKEFGRFGEMEKVQVVLDGHSGRSRGFAFIYYASVDDAAEAKREMNGTELDGKKIRVDFSITKRAHTPTPGMYMGRPTGGRSRTERSDRGDRDRDDRDRRGYGDRDYDRRRRSPSPRYRRRSRSYSPVPRYRADRY
ncbi:transformer-2 protein homolog alpha [Eurytemora carolleeae]|uniref:transformer-2 protein homolog alpha n=1 Tax=Eurytemora carolleeae TaxID=1294199 RepID=UPI000C788EE7|nr:transformer-2 protein homolog alpha [Eurytemora carolleeae]XP_023339091.1 transformer-2 protein homolog alpha [Eurytemora carolleeae]|eukprot:XP_023339090.1 transformer-2 protein homolog alpha-like [Eurytemora affinis]